MMYEKNDEEEMFEEDVPVQNTPNKRVGERRYPPAEDQVEGTLTFEAFFKKAEYFF